MRYYRRISLGKHIKLNVSKSGISTSIKIGGLTINPQRNRVTYNTPIKGLSFRGKLYDDKADIGMTQEEWDRLEELTDRIFEGFLMVAMIISIIVAFATKY